MTSHGCIARAPHAGSGDNTALSFFEYQGSQLLYCQMREKMISEDKVLTQSSRLLSVEHPHSFHHWLSKKWQTCLKIVFRRYYFTKFFIHLSRIFFNMLYAPLCMIIRVPCDRETNHCLSTDNIMFSTLTGCSENTYRSLTSNGWERAECSFLQEWE